VILVIITSLNLNKHVMFVREAFLLLLAILLFLGSLTQLQYSLPWRLLRCWKSPSPQEKQSAVATLVKDNELRLNKADSYLSTSLKVPLAPLSSAELIICIVTKPRESGNGWKPNYVRQSVAAYHKAAREATLATALLICDVEEKEELENNRTTGNTELTEMKKHIPLVERWRSGKSPQIKVNRLEKEKQDYLFCLEAASKLSPREGVLLVEDDSLPGPHLVSRLHQLVLRQPRERTAFVKLFHPPSLLGYINPEPYRWVEWVSLSLLVLLLLKLPLSLTNLLAVMFFFEVVGRQTLLAIRPNYSLVPAPHCCTPANLYPAASIPKVLNFLNSTKCGPGLAKDFALVRMLKEQHLNAWAVEPNLVRHIGAVSSLGSGVNLNV